MRNLKKVAAITLAMTMAMGSSFSAFAEDPTSGTLSGTGEVEGVVDKDIVKVILPTTTDAETTYNFKLDPEGLIKATAAAKYPSATFGEGSMFFQNAADSYSNTSNTKEITNKSAVPVDITITATVTAGNENLKINSDSAFTDDTSTSMYLALTDTAADSPQVEAASSEGVAVLTTTMQPLADSYKISYNDSEGKYEYVLKDDADIVGDFETYEFALTGACNTSADWSQLTEIQPKVDVVWSFAKHSENNNVLSSDGSNDIVIYYEGAKPSAVTLTPVSITGTNKASISLSTSDKVVITDETVSVTASCLATLLNSSSRGAGVYKVTINSTDYTITLTK